MVYPAKGKWIKPRWVRVGDVNAGKKTQSTKTLCNPTCTARKGTWSNSIYARKIATGTPYKGFAAASVQLPGGCIRTITASYGS